MEKESATIVAFAGRRIDATDAKISRFPLTQVGVVQKQLEELFHQENIGLLICSAACGADLMALQVAQELGIHYRIVLPFAYERFRITSVIDRPSTEKWNWGTLFDQVISSALKKEELVVLEMGEDQHAGYQAVNHAILNEAVQEGRNRIEVTATGSPRELSDVQAVIVWDGCARGPHDLTLHFAEEARARGLVVKEILTLQK